LIRNQEILQDFKEFNDDAEKHLEIHNIESIRSKASKVLPLLRINAPEQSGYSICRSIHFLLLECKYN
jgi:hypothetical protein